MPEGTPMPAVGDMAPDISKRTTTGEPFALSEQRGKWVAVYFYPRANTPG